MKSPLSVGRYVLEEVRVATTIETLSLLLDIKGEHTLLILIYRPLGTIHSFVIDLRHLIEYVLFTVNFNRNNNEFITTTSVNPSTSLVREKT